MAKLNSLRKSSVSHDPSETILKCWFAARETFLVIISVENSCADYFFVEMVMHSFGILWFIESWKEQHLFEM